MKKVYLFGIILAATTTHFAPAFADVQGVAVGVPAPQAGCPKAFQGFHLGGNVGYGIGWNKRKAGLFAADTDEGFATKSDLAVKGFDGGIGVGYTHRYCNWAIGIAFDANWANSKGKTKFGEAFLEENGDDDDNGDDIEFTNTEFTSKTRLRNTLQLYGRLGYVIREVAMPFIGLGWENAEWKQEIFRGDDSDENSNNSASKKKRLNGFMWKAGVDFLATRHVIVGFEYTGSIAKKKSFTKTFTLNGEEFEASSSIKPQYNKFALTAKIIY